jgi:hypothetical protein
VVTSGRFTASQMDHRPFGVGVQILCSFNFMSFTTGKVCQTEYRGGHLPNARRRGGSQDGGNGCYRNAQWHCHEAAGAVRRASFPNDLHTVHSHTRRDCAVLISVQKAKEHPVCAEFETSAEYGVLQEQRNVRITSKRSQGMEHCHALRNAAYEAVMGRFLTSGERL